MNKRRSLYLIMLLLVLLVLMIAAVFIGVYEFDNGVLKTVFNLVFYPDIVSESDRYIIQQIRLPRIVIAVLAGAGLGVSGSALQGLFKNPLASPGLIGITSGAVLFAAVTIVLGGYIKEYLPLWISYSLLSIMSFIGAVLTMWFVYRISTSSGKTNIGVLLLSGVAITALSAAITGVLTFVSNEQELRNLTFWTLGSLAGSNWEKVFILSVVMAISLKFLLPLSKQLNALMLGEKDACHLGVSIEAVKRKIIIFTALMVGIIVCFTGTIGFVGLVVPYILRLVFGSNYYYVLPLSVLLGGILLLLADTLSRSLIAPVEIPIGILTSMMGAPVFMGLLLKYKKNL
ncbi:iron ABC transporter permease [Myroides pelagicus]|uniref:FecCD family ABC transporter permease n=1 Tax=Myroides pelagicus TaxID=270914 RepID=UPI002DBC4D19|nr:iron ABC transporter permease [Myroides pelagicus]MEC4115076.1 iron ABC transporter permease [Myroides pelagicus]